MLGAEPIHVAHLEGLAANGFVKRFWVEECSEWPGRKRVYAELADGRVVVTKCIDGRGVKKVIYYLAEAKRLASIVVTGVATGMEADETFPGD